MTKEFENLISLLKSPIKENRDLGAILAQHYEGESKAHFGYGTELIEFILRMKKSPLREILKISLFLTN